jgi:glutamyl-tRNA synthetase
VAEASRYRCRFAPSPTGYLHVGSAQSALFNWLFARSSGARFLLRIEDTDAERNRPELTDNILAMLVWLGIEWDGEPVHQSDHQARHVAAVERLADAGRAYWCECTPDDVAARYAARGERPMGYDGFCRDRGLERGPGRALRFRTPLEGETTWPDVVRGEVRVQNRHLDDFVVLRSSGAPLFIVANAIDDADMGITHVIRGEDHVSNTPRYILLWQALEFGPLPIFAHLPLMVNEQRKKLSKRRDDVSVADYKARGFLGPAMRNYLALLGWGPNDDIEVRPIEEIIGMFRLEDVSPAPAFFDVKKLTHINAQYIRMLPTGEFVRLAAEFLPREPRAHQALEELAPLVQQRVRTLAEVPDFIAFLWQDRPELDEPAWQKATRDPRSADMLRLAAEALERSEWTAEAVEEAVRGAATPAGYVGEGGNVQLSKAQAPIRVALTGRSVGPPLWESIVALGRERTLDRLATAQDHLAS